MTELVHDHPFVAIATLLFVLGIIAILWLIIDELLTRGPRVAKWTAKYSKNSDGSGQCVLESGVFYANRERTIPNTIEVQGEFDHFWFIMTKIPRWEYSTYYLVKETIKIRKC